MTTLTPRPPYTPDELDRLYPKTLQLRLVQIVRYMVYLGVSPLLSGEQYSFGTDFRDIQLLRHGRLTTLYLKVV